MSSAIICHIVHYSFRKAIETFWPIKKENWRKNALWSL